ncbi:MAG TPA: TonB-dependent receptor [Cyclobacteriaceae bacterium]|nr:TonB-dependent receptor [Cyclobacteriaceae bacterium]
MKIILQCPPIKWSKLLLGILTFCIISNTSSAWGQRSLASAHEANYNQPANELDVFVSIRLKDAKVKALLDAIEDRTGFRFVYDKSVLGYNMSFTIEEDQISLYRLLEKVSNTSDLRFKQVNRNINVRLANKEPEPGSEEIADITVTGTVVDQNGDPIPGATVSIPELGLGTATDIDGRYSLTVPDGATLVFSFVGFQSQSIAVGNQRVINVTLAEDISALDEVVVVGYGTQKKATITGAISVVGGDEIMESPTINYTNALAGRLSGLTVISGSGEPGRDASTLRIRGVNTLGNSDPLIVIDGIANRSMDRLDPADIESISILKDASAAIYGSQAANGVILITTKRGTENKPVVRLNFNKGWNRPTVIPELADAAEYATMMNELNLYRGTPQPFSADDIQKFQDGSSPWTHPNTDWFEETLEQYAPQHYGNVSISGGSENIQYYLSAGTNFQDGIYKNSATYYSQVDFRGNFDVKLSDYINVGVNLMGRQENRNYPTVATSQIWNTIINSMPIVTAYWPNGLPGPDVQLGKSPLMATDLTGYSRDKDYVMESNVKLDVKIPGIEGLLLTGNLSFDKNINNNKLWQTPWLLYSWDGQSYDENNDPLLRGAYTGYSDPRLSQSFTDGHRSFMNLLVNYNLDFGDSHNVNILVGGEKIEGESMFVSASRRYFASTAIDQLFAGGDLLKDNNGSASVNSRLNTFGRINYDFANKYLAEVVWRLDGSYIFPKGKRFGFFPGFSLGWVLSEEDFWNVEALDFLKLRGSWGQTGNDRISPYQFLASYNIAASSGNYIFNGNVEAQTMRASRIPNPNVTWEVASQTNLGVDGEMFNGKINFSVEYFYNLRSNILAFRNASVPGSSGLTLPRENIGEVENKGFDFTVGYNSTAGNFSYGVSVNGGLAKNKILFWDEEPGIPEYQRTTGRPMGSTLNYRVLGVFDDQADLDRYPHMEGAQPGDLIFEDYNGDGKIDGLDMVRDDRSTVPTFTGGASIDLGYKRFYASILFQGAAGAVRSTYKESEGEGFNYLKSNVEGRWTPDNPTADKPRAYNRVGVYWRANPGYNNTYYMKSSDYLRLKNLMVGYELPETLAAKVGLSQASVYVSGQNLLTFTGLKDFDPESPFNLTIGTVYPTNKVINVGLSLMF